MYVLPEWNGKVVGEMHRYRISHEMLADAAGYSRPYVTRVLNSDHVTFMAQSAIDGALDKLKRRIENDAG